MTLNCLTARVLRPHHPDDHRRGAILSHGPPLKVLKVRWNTKSSRREPSPRLLMPKQELQTMARCSEATRQADQGMQNVIWRALIENTHGAADNRGDGLTSFGLLSWGTQDEMRVQ